MSCDTHAPCLTADGWRRYRGYRRRRLCAEIAVRKIIAVDSAHKLGRGIRLHYVGNHVRYFTISHGYERGPTAKRRLYAGADHEKLVANAMYAVPRIGYDSIILWLVDFVQMRNLNNFCWLICFVGLLTLRTLRTFAYLLIFNFLACLLSTLTLNRILGTRGRPAIMSRISVARHLKSEGNTPSIRSSYLGWFALLLHTALNTTFNSI